MTPLENMVRTVSASRHVLVTGGAGYMGSVLVPLLLTAGYEVSVVDIFLFGNSLQQVSHPQLHIYEADITAVDAVTDLFATVDAVVHLASVSNDPTCDLDPNLTIRTNYLATTALARSALAHNVQQFIFASSCSVYGASGSRLLDERSHVGPVTLYALTKLASERELLELSRDDFRVTVLRFGTLFGFSPRMRFDIAINLMIKRALLGQPLVVHGTGRQYRPFVHVRDAAEAILAVLQAGPVTQGHIFNIGADEHNFTISELAQLIHSHFPSLSIERQSNNADVRSYRVRFQKVHDIIHFMARRTVADAVQEISTAYKAHLLGTMEEDQYYNIAVIKQRYKQAAQELQYQSAAAHSAVRAA